MRAVLILLAAASLALAAPAAGAKPVHHKPAASAKAKAKSTKAKGKKAEPETAKSTAKPKARPETDEPVDDSGLGRLFRASPEAVRSRLGDPDVARAEGKGAFWTYRLPHCALFLFFREGPHGLRVSGASTGPRKRGEPIPDVPACLAGAVQGADDAP